MTRLQFIIVTSLSSVLALCILLQILFVRLSVADESRLQAATNSLQQGQASYNQTKAIAQRVAQLAQVSNDQTLKDILTRHGIQIRNPAPASSETTPQPAPASKPATNP